ncbi:Non-specific cytotoxic cell receptor protein 1-like protein [Heterocephalus glaber]|uniref:Non-specific cytotoxic cell receptor protein 1-like protein n=1 Tax=Heterocephalus glaber TaxID=10181 RepID=G5AM92_HETGA|nr:Non-specific cytotoxic cell receptor protein 1-like protein [Heterocephalus glaber]
MMHKPQPGQGRKPPPPPFPCTSVTALLPEPCPALDSDSLLLSCADDDEDDRAGQLGINIYQPAPPTRPTRQPLEALGKLRGQWLPGEGCPQRNAVTLPPPLPGNFRGWHIRTELLHQNLSWTVKQQCVNLLAEGLWEELLDDEQPDVTIMDWYEDSRLDQCVYELHVWLLAADRRTVIAQHHVAPRSPGRGPAGHWIQVSHVFRQYGPGVRFIHFLHKTKNRMESGGLRRTRVTDSSVSVQLRE